MKADVDDLVHWKHKVWGMVILGGALITIATALWAFIGNRVQWKSDVVSQNLPDDYAGSATSAWLSES